MYVCRSVRIGVRVCVRVAVGGAAQSLYTARVAQSLEPRPDTGCALSCDRPVLT